MDKTKHGLLEYGEVLIFAQRELELQFERKNHFGFFLSFVLGSPCSSKKVKKRKLVGREEIKVWKSNMELLYGNYHKSLFV